MSKPIAKITVRCPHCGSEQQEPELAKSTFCRKCSEYFAISSAVLASAAKPTPSAFAPKLGAIPPASSEPSHGSGLRDKFDQFFGKPRTRVAQCFECVAAHEVSASAQSTTCRTCGAYIDLQDYRITGSFSRNIVTRGSVHLTSKGDLSSSRIVCENAILHGKMRGNLTCSGKMIIRTQGRMPGTLQARQVIVEKGADILVSRPMKAAQAEIAGKMVGPIICEGQVMIYKSGFLDGAVTAKGFAVEKGGCFQGELTISPHDLTAGNPANAPMSDEANRRAEPMQQEPLLGGEQNPAMG